MIYTCYSYVKSLIACACQLSVIDLPLMNVKFATKNIHAKVTNECKSLPLTTRSKGCN